MAFTRCSAALLASSTLLLLACPPEKPPPSVGFFRATPVDLQPGESSQLTWKAFDAAFCTLGPEGLRQPVEGATIVSPTATTTYELECGGARSKVTVRVTPNVSIVRFTASAPSVVEDSPVELSWETLSAETCTLQPAVGEVPVNGRLSVVVSARTDFTLSCEGTGPAASARQLVDVTALSGPLAPPTGVALTPLDGMLQVSWTQAAGSGVVYVAEAPGVERATISTLPGGGVFRRVLSPFTLSGLVNGRAYYVRLAALSGPTESALTAEQSASPAGSTVAARDPLFGAQWHLVNANAEDIDVSPPWAAGLRGEGVKIAVVDEGVDLAHEDLRQNVLTGLSHDYLGASPVRLAEHGTCVAGLVAARDGNGKGVRGVAPRAGVMSFNLLLSLSSLNEYDAMTRHQDLVAVSNNSWGDAWDNSGLLTHPDPQWLRGVREGATQGRGGKGVVYFWASGNGGDPSETGALDDSNFDGQANSRFVLAVGGVGKDGKKATYAEGGANVLVVAPTEGDDGQALVTTDLTGRAGYNPGGETTDLLDGNYTKTMNGTSGSTPVAAGVGALVLQARPELSYRDVRRVLARSARKADPGSPGWSTNGAGLPVHHGYGFGVVDANAAVALARTIEPVGPELSHVASATPAAAIPDGDLAGLASSLTVSGSGISRVEVVEVEVSITHLRTADLELVLEKSGGATDVLYPFHACADLETGAATDCSPIDGFVFSSVRHLDEPADGTWTLRVKDRRAPNGGLLDRWSLRLYGSR